MTSKELLYVRRKLNESASYMYEINRYCRKVDDVQWKIELSMDCLDEKVTNTIDNDDNGMLSFIYRQLREEIDDFQKMQTCYEDAQEKSAEIIDWFIILLKAL